MKLLTTLVLVALSAAASAYEFAYETIVSGVDHPTSLVFINQSTALLTERNGGLRYIRDGELDPTPISGVPEVFVAGQAGLFDVLVDPDFNDNRIIYLSFAQGTAKANTLKIARATLNDHKLQDLKVIFAAQPLRDTAFHYGGRMIFLPDGTLLLTSERDSTIVLRPSFLTIISAKSCASIRMAPYPRIIRL